MSETAWEKSWALPAAVRVRKWWRNADVHFKSQGGFSVPRRGSAFTYMKSFICVFTALGRKAMFCFRNVNRAVATTRIN